MENDTHRLGKYADLIPGTTPPPEEWHTADAFLFEALEAIGRIWEIKDSTLLSLPDTFRNSSGIEIPLHDVYAVSDAVSHALDTYTELMREEIEEFAGRCMRICIRALGGSDVYNKKFSRKLFLRAVSKINASVDVDTSYDFPSLAVYARGNSKTVYVDRRVPRKVTLADGRTFDLFLPLLVHEVLEKALYDTVPLPARGFQSFHQIAQRLEQEVVEELDVSWKEYQDNIMEPLILKLADAPVEILPPDVDLRPIIDAGDMKLVELLK